jgi:hypothetical protein
MGIKVCKELTSENMKEVIETLMATVTEPQKGLSEAKLQIAAALLESEASGWLPEDASTIALIVGTIVASIGAIAYLYLRIKK